MKFFSFNKSQGAVLATILILIFLGAAYFFIYLPNNEKRIQEQHFRALQNIDRNIHTKIDNSVALLRNLLNAYGFGGKAGYAKALNDSIKWNHYIEAANNSPTSFSFIKPRKYVDTQSVAQKGAS